MIAPIAHLSSLTRNGDWEQALTFLVEYFHGVVKSAPYSAFPFPDFDRACLEIGQNSAFELFNPSSSSATGGDYDLVIITEATVLGGHVELLKDIADGSERNVVVVATNLYNRSEAIVDSSIKRHGRVVSTVQLDAPSLVARLRELQGMIADPRARRIILLNHAHDAIAIAAAAPISDKPVLFFHHCDHTPSLGCHLPHAQHIDLHNLAHKSCSDELGLSPGYICMTSSPPSTLRSEGVFAVPMFKSITCGGEHKLTTPAYPFGYRDVVVRLVRTLGGVHFHVGRLSPEFVGSIQDDLENEGLPRDSFVHVGHVGGFGGIVTALEIDLYVPTLPQSGGKAAIDAMSAGVPILVHENAIGRLWGSRDLIYPEAASWRDLLDLEKILQRFKDIKFLKSQALASQTYFQAYHSPALFREMLKANGRQTGHAPPPLKPYRPSYQERLFQAALRAEEAAK